MPASPRLTRRTALVGTLGGALGGLALSACDADDLRPHDEKPSAGPSGTPSAPTADEALVDTVSGQILVALDAVGAARKVHDLHDSLGPLLRAHDAHLALLGKTRSPRRPKRVPKPLQALVAAETALQHQLADAAVHAESGALARALASMSASIAQHLVTAPLAGGSAPS